MKNSFTYALLLFLLAVIIYRVKSTLMTSDKKTGQVFQPWTLYALTMMHIIIGIVCMIEYFTLVETINYPVTVLGFVLFSLSVIGRYWALNTLGKYHSAQIEIRENHPLVTSGPYRYIRHPIYFFTIIEVISCCLIPNAWYALLLTMFIYTPLLILRLLLEEKVLAEKFGASYLHYRETVPCLIPFTKRYHHYQVKDT